LSGWIAFHFFVHENLQHHRRRDSVSPAVGAEVEEGDRGAGERGRGKHEPMIVKVVLFLARASTDGMSVADWTVCVGPVVVTDVALESANYKSSAKFEAARARRVDRKKDARRT
jgi:hypothetical protein